MLRHYVRFYYPGLVVSESGLTALDGPVAVPERCQGYEIVARAEQDSAEGRLVGEFKRIGRMVWFGELVTLAQVKVRMPSQRILISNMEGNGYPAVVMTQFGGCYPVTAAEEVKPPGSVSQVSPPGANQ